VRSILTTTGIAASVALLIVSFYGMDSVDYVIDVTYSQTSRQDVSLSFNEIKDDRVRYDVANLPGVMRAEPYRTVPVTLRHGLNEERVGVIGMPPDAELTQLLDPAFRPMEVPDIGIVLSEMLADLLDVRRGDMLQVAFKTGRQREVLLPVTGISQAYLGLNAHMHLDLLNDLMGDGDVVSGANIKVDETKLPALYDAVKETPAVSSIALLNKSRQSFRDTLAENINTMTAMFIALSAIIAFGVVYNSVRIQLSERGRELASLRILGFTQGEVMLILFGEVIVLLLIAIPIGWVAGYILAGAVAAGMETELYRVPLIVDRDTYAKAALVAIVSTLASAVIMRWRIARMDLIAVLKTRA
jgi:putative ABC transport system permease protein